MLKTSLLRGRPVKYQRLLKISTRRSDLMQIHACMLKTGLNTSPFPMSKLLAASAPVDFAYTRSIFETIQDPNLFMFNMILRGLALCEIPAPEEAIFLFNSIRSRGISLDQFSFIATIKSCSRGLAFWSGQQLHGIILKLGFDCLLNLRNSLTSFYCAVSVIDHAQQVFDEVPHKRDAVSWSALLKGYLQISRPIQVLELFLAMRDAGVDVTPSTAMIVLSASNHVTYHGLGESLHGYCIKSGFCSDSYLASSILTMYCRTGSMDSAWKVFDDIPKRRGDVVPWNCMVDGYAKGCQIEQSLNVLQQMKVEGLRPTTATLLSLLSACATSGNLFIGQQISELATEEMLNSDTVLGTSLIHMYSKCGLIDRSTEVFNKMQNKDVKSWTAMITGFGVNGQPRAALQLFDQMEEAGMRPNKVTFLAVLSACCHGGFVVTGQQLFKRMVKKYHISPSKEHYGCFVDTLGRAGMLEEAYELIESLPIKKDPLAWRALLSACRIHGHVEIGELAKQSLLDLGCQHPTDSILLSNTYAGACRQMNNVVENEELGEMKKKQVGLSSIEIDE